MEVLTYPPFLIGLAGGALSAVVSWVMGGRRKTSATPSLEERIRTLGDALADSARAIDIIEREMRAKQQLVASLEADAKRYEQLSALHRNEVEAVAQLVRAEIRTETNRASRQQFWSGFLLNAFFFAAGAGLTLLAS